MRRKKAVVAALTVGRRRHLGERFDKFEDGSVSAPARQKDAFYFIPRARQKPRMR